MNLRPSITSRDDLLFKEWIGGYELDITDMYGMRKYTEGRLDRGAIYRFTDEASSSLRVIICRRRFVSSTLL